MKKLKPITLSIILIIIIILGIAGMLYFNGQEDIVACTEDARVCPDGSSVSRVAPDCEFAPCPNKECSVNSDCAVFGKTGECNCGCYNKDFLPQNSGGACFCAAPTSCECIDNKCEGIFE